MLLESLVKATVELQGFRVVTVTGDAGRLVAELAPDRRFLPRCGQCGERGWYRDSRRVRYFRHVPLPLWGIAVALRYAPRRVRCLRCDGCACRVDALGQWETAEDPSAGGDARDVGPGLVLAAGRSVVPMLGGTVATAVEKPVAYGLAHRDLENLTHFDTDSTIRPSQPVELPRAVVFLQLDHVVHGPVVAFDLSLRHRMIRRPARVRELVRLQVVREFPRDVTGAVVAQQPGPTDYTHLHLWSMAVFALASSNVSMTSDVCIDVRRVHTTM